MSYLELHEKNLMKNPNSKKSGIEVSQKSNLQPKLFSAAKNKISGVTLTTNLLYSDIYAVIRIFLIFIGKNALFNST